jgi:hypothetical protein
MVFEGEEVVLKLEKYRNAGYLLFSFPFKGKAGMGMGFSRATNNTDYDTIPHPHPNPPLEREGTYSGTPSYIETYEGHYQPAATATATPKQQKQNLFGSTNWYI